MEQQPWQNCGVLSKSKHFLGELKKKKSTRPTASVSAVIHWSLFTGRVEGVIVLSGIHRLQKENHKKNTPQLRVVP